MARIPIVKIVNPNDPGKYLIINVADFDETKHQVWAGEPERMQRVLDRDDRIILESVLAPRNVIPPSPTGNRLDGYTDTIPTMELALGQQPRRAVARDESK